MANKAKTISDFKDAHDKDVIVPRKIQAALDGMLKTGTEHWEYESDVVKLAGISQTEIARYREQFVKHIVVAPAVHGKGTRNVWFANAKVAAKLRGE